MPKLVCLISVFQKLISWDYDTQHCLYTSIEFMENVGKTKKHLVSGNSVGGKALLIREVRGKKTSQ